MGSPYLHEASLVAETVAAILSHAMEVGLVLPVTAVAVLAVLIEPEADVAVWDGLVFEDAHATLEAHLFRIRTHAQLVDRGMRRPLGSRGRTARRTEAYHRIGHEQI